MSLEVGFGTGAAVGGFMFILMPILMIAIVGLGIFFAIKAYKEAKRRQAAIAATVAASHLGHIAEDPARTSYFTAAPFGNGDHRRARDIVWGSLAGRPFETFAYSYETHTTDSDGKRNTTTHHFQITWVALPGPLPTMRFTSDNALMRTFAKMGARDLSDLQLVVGALHSIVDLVPPFVFQAPPGGNAPLAQP